MKIILSTCNPSKAEQIKALFHDTQFQVVSLDEAGILGEAVEDGQTLEENALKKALYARQRLQEPCYVMADDTGVYIRALNGEPGVYAARWAGEDASTEETTHYCLMRMQGVSDRSASMKTVVVVISPEGTQHVFTGEVNGVMRESALIPAQPKMPYSPLFMPEGSNKVWAEMTVEEENALSHRGKAFRQVVEFFKQL